MASLSILQNCTEEHLNASPFPYIFIPNALPEKYYTELEATLPVRETLIEWMQADVNPLICSYHNISKNLPPIWQDFFAYHVSADFVAEVVKWGARLNEKSPLFGAVSFSDIASTAEVPEQIGVRNMGMHKINTDCQMVNNAPGKTRLVGPHLDNPREIYAALLYMRHQEDKAKGGELEVYSARKKKYSTYGKDRLKRKYVKRERTIPYRENTLLLFYNSPKSFHGVSKRKRAKVARRHINIIGEYEKKLFNNRALLSNSKWDERLWEWQKRHGKII